jgi:ketosteroid isomerase-like protein
MHLRRLVIPFAVSISAIMMWHTRAVAEASPDRIIALERAALDRWGKGDPQGYIETFAPEITYFDPFTAKRIDGLPAMKAMLRPFTGKIHVDRYEMSNPRVQESGDIGVLTYNLHSHVKRPDGSPTVVRWNSTAVYRRAGGTWKMIHSHWSFTQPELKQPAGP